MSDEPQEAPKFTHRQKLTHARADFFRTFAAWVSEEMGDCSEGEKEAEDTQFAMRQLVAILIDGRNL